MKQNKKKHDIKQLNYKVKTFLMIMRYQKQQQNHTKPKITRNQKISITKQMLYTNCTLRCLKHNREQPSATIN